MPPEANIGDRYRVGPYEVDLRRRRVALNDAEVDVSPTSMEVLEALIRSHPQPLSPDELLEQAWSGKVVNRETVKQQIRRIREQMAGENGTHVVENRRGHGYYLPQLQIVSRRGLMSIRMLAFAALVVTLAGVATAMLRPGFGQLALPIIVAVLPFDDLTSTSDERARALQESLIHAIATQTESSRVRVLSRSTLTAHTTRPAARAEQMDADFLFEGSITDLTDGSYEVRARFVYVPRGYSAWESEYALAEISTESLAPVGEDIAAFLRKKADWIETRGD